MLFHPKNLADHVFVLVIQSIEQLAKLEVSLFDNGLKCAVFGLVSRVPFGYVRFVDLEGVVEDELLLSIGGSGLVVIVPYVGKQLLEEHHLVIMLMLSLF